MADPIRPPSLPACRASCATFASQRYRGHRRYAYSAMYRTMQVGTLGRRCFLAYVIVEASLWGGSAPGVTEKEKERKKRKVLMSLTHIHPTPTSTTTLQLSLSLAIPPGAQNHSPPHVARYLNAACFCFWSFDAPKYVAPRRRPLQHRGRRLLLLVLLRLSAPRSRCHL